MNRICFLLSICLFTFCQCKRKDPARTEALSFPSWEGSPGGNGCSAIHSRDGNLILCVMSSPKETFSLIKATPSGSLLWRRDYPYEPDMGGIWSLIEDNNSDIYVSLLTYGNFDSSKANTLIMKASSTGNPIWIKNFGTPQTDYYGQLLRLGDGNLLMCSLTIDTFPVQDGKIMLTKFNPDGQILWRKKYDGVGDGGWPYALVTKSGDILTVFLNVINHDVNAVRFTADGNKIWEKSYTKLVAKDYEIANGVVEADNGDFLICGQHVFTDSPSSNKILLMRILSNGDFLWRKELGKEGESSVGNAIVANHSGGFGIIGFSYTSNFDGNKILLIQTNNDGLLEFYKTPVHAKDEDGVNILLNQNGNYLGIGECYQANHRPFGNETFLIQMDLSGQIH